MEDVYVIKVKTKPAVATLYPSERRYSASTVGGLSLVHVIFGTLALLLGIFGKSAQGIILFVACLAPLASGILAWKRWYIDRHITIFFYCCIFSAAVSTSCFVASVYDASVLTEKAVTLGNGVDEDLPYNQTLEAGNSSSEVSSTSLTVLDIFSENGTTVEETGADEEEVVVYGGRYVETRLFLTVNIAVACLLEFVWSAVSIRIALKGMKKDGSEDNDGGNANGDKKAKVMSSALSSRPDIILMNKHICCSMQSLDSLQSLNVQNMYPKLPLPESNREFKERVENFLTNQVHHRPISDGS